MKKSTILLLTFLFGIKLFAQNEVHLKSGEQPLEKGDLKGVVTYFFNDNYGDKPDVGAEVIIYKTGYVRPSRDTMGDTIAMKDFNVFARLTKAKFDWQMAEENYTHNQQMHNLNKRKYPLKNYNDLPERKCKAMQDSADKIIDAVKYKEGTIRTTADGNGNYSAKLEPGSYGIIFISKHKERETGYSDIWEGMAFIKANETVTESQEFR